MYSDGGSRGNPGPAGAGVYIEDGEGKVVKKIAKFLGKRTNNWAEYEAVVLGLEALKRQFGEKLRSMDIELRMDSELIVRQLNGIYRVKNPDLREKYMKIQKMRAEDFLLLKIKHIRREKNKEADALANEAMDAGESLRHIDMHDKS
ncbi:MAG: ribonuclease h [Parcubacteria group bacterium Greene0714_4]|nr:MAG: ribonuclease h [Parcubacteria group bacterium Greene1014_15]TSD08183.1 MAG: ribonuclease h [Parcubacteria group bacterium Greene0714_4]